MLDIGCGRGEFLELLKQRGITARGLDLNHEMVETSRARGLDVTEGDALGYLESLPDASLGGIFAAQVVEHLDPRYLMRLLETAAHKIRPGGVIVLETINPACWLAFFESFIRDVTHVWPLHPETLQYLVRASGFARVDIEYPSPVAEASRLQTVPAPSGDVDACRSRIWSRPSTRTSSKLNARLFTFQDYAAIGTKVATDDRWRNRETTDQLIADNRKAGHDFHLLEQFDAGVALIGSEVKAIREGRVNLRDSYCKLERAEAFLLNVHIGQYSHDGFAGHDPLRPRKLLLHRSELNKLLGKTTEKGLTIVPLRMYLPERPGQGHGRARQGQEDATTSARPSAAGRPTARPARQSRRSGYNCPP